MKKIVNGIRSPDTLLIQLATPVSPLTVHRSLECFYQVVLTSFGMSIEFVCLLPSFLLGWLWGCSPQVLVSSFQGSSVTIDHVESSCAGSWRTQEFWASKSLLSVANLSSALPLNVGHRFPDIKEKEKKIL